MGYQHHAAQGAPDRAEATLARIAATVERTEHLLAAVLDTLVTRAPAPRPAQRAPELPPVYTQGAHYAAAFPPALDGGKAGPDSIYPNAALTPGVPNAQVTQDNIAETIGKVGWTATIRPPVSTTSVIKAHIMARDNLPGPASLYELDHFISLELGGHPSDLGNLWCQKYTAEIPDGGAHQKDAVETALKVMIVGGLISLAEGQRRITQDWYAEYLNLHKMGMLPMLAAYDPDGSSGSPLGSTDDDA